MPSVGPKYPGAGTQTLTALTPWSGVSNITAEDSVSASCDMTAGNSSEHLIGYNFDFSSVPDTATLDGIVIETRQRSNSSTISYVAVSFGRWNGMSYTNDSDVLTGAWASSYSYLTFGGATDLWLSGYTVADLKDSEFCVRLRAECSVYGPDPGEVDTVRVTAYYSEAVPNYQEAQRASAPLRVARVTRQSLSGPEDYAGPPVSSLPFHIEANLARPYRVPFRPPATPPERAAFIAYDIEPAPTFFASATARPSRVVRTGIGVIAGPEDHTVTPVPSIPYWIEADFLRRIPGPVGRPPAYSTRHYLGDDAPIYADSLFARGRKTPPAPVPGLEFVVGMEPGFTEAVVGHGVVVPRASRSAYLAYSQHSDPDDLALIPPQPDAPAIAGRASERGISSIVADPRTLVVMQPATPESIVIRGASGPGRGVAGEPHPVQPYTTVDYGPLVTGADTVRLLTDSTIRTPSHSLGALPDIPLVREADCVRTGPRVTIARSSLSGRAAPLLHGDGDLLPDNWGYLISASTASPLHHAVTGRSSTDYQRPDDPPPLPCSDAVRPHRGAQAGRGRGVDLPALSQYWVAPALQYAGADAVSARRTGSRSAVISADPRPIESYLWSATADAVTAPPVRERGSWSDSLPVTEFVELTWWSAAVSGETVRTPPGPYSGRASGSDYDGRAGHLADASEQIAQQSAALSSEARSSRQEPRRGAGDITSWHGAILTDEDQLRGWSGGGVSLPRRVGRAGARSGEWIVSAELASETPLPLADYTVMRGRYVLPSGFSHSAAPDWRTVGLIVYAGPGYAVAGGVWFAGATAGMIVEG